MSDRSREDGPRRKSLLNRVARRVSHLRRRAEEGLEALQDEASHPGIPQAHMQGRNAFYRTDADRQAERDAPSADYRPGGDPTVDPHARPAEDGAAGDDAWYLRGDNEGWDETNPSRDDDD